MTLPGNPKNVHLKVTLYSEKPGDFTIEPTPPGSLPIAPNGDLIFRNDGHSGFFIYFDLVDKSGLNYTFPPDNKKHEAVWSQLAATGCPAEGKTDIFTAKQVSEKSMTLKVRNENIGNDVGDFRYMLRVTKDGGNTFHPLDPGGSNQNGPITAGSRNSPIVFLIGAAVGAVAVFGAQALLHG